MIPTLSEKRQDYSFIIILTLPLPLWGQTASTNSWTVLIFLEQQRGHPNKRLFEALKVGNPQSLLHTRKIPGDLRVKLEGKFWSKVYNAILSGDSRTTIFSTSLHSLNMPRPYLKGGKPTFCTPWLSTSNKWYDTSNPFSVSKHSINVKCLYHPLWLISLSYILLFNPPLKLPMIYKY